MKAKYKHINIIARDWRKLAKFYEIVFNCIPLSPGRELSGDWLSKGTNVDQAAFEGIHLTLPGHGIDGPTLEIFQYDKNDNRLALAANSTGFGHIAFEVDNVSEACEEVIQAGGSMVGEIVENEVEGVGILTFAYTRDPESNIIELQSWS